MKCTVWRYDSKTGVGAAHEEEMELPPPYVPEQHRDVLAELDQLKADNEALTAEVDALKAKP